MVLNRDNFSLFAAMHYDNPQCLSETEFLKDIAILSSLKRYITRYTNNENICLKMITNTLITFYNVFEHKAATKMIAFKFSDDELQHINAFLFYLNYPMTSNKYNQDTLNNITRAYQS